MYALKKQEKSQIKIRTHPYTHTPTHTHTHTPIENERIFKTKHKFSLVASCGCSLGAWLLTGGRRKVGRGQVKGAVARRTALAGCCSVWHTLRCVARRKNTCSAFDCRLCFVEYEMRVCVAVCVLLQFAGCCQKVYVAEQLTYKRCENNK